ncbi:MAG: hypothetical protein JKY54_01655 [Flavobacteriales bacterium]|nr:hypothetical protein [Flavobacteriales bacterium]
MEKEHDSFYTWKALNSQHEFYGYNPGKFLLGLAAMIISSFLLVGTQSIILFIALVYLFYYFIILGKRRKKVIKESSDKSGIGDVFSPDKKEAFNAIPKKYIDRDNFLNYLIKEEKND